MINHDTVSEPEFPSILIYCNFKKNEIWPEWWVSLDCYGNDDSAWSKRQSKYFLNCLDFSIIFSWSWLEIFYCTDLSTVLCVIVENVNIYLRKDIIVKNIFNFILIFLIEWQKNTVFFLLSCSTSGFGILKFKVHTK